jgi:hypothetical protein
MLITHSTIKIVNLLNKIYLNLNGFLIGLTLRANGLMFGLTQTRMNGNQGNNYD